MHHAPCTMWCELDLLVRPIWMMDHQGWCSIGDRLLAETPVEKWMLFHILFLHFWSHHAMSHDEEVIQSRSIVASFVISYQEHEDVLVTTTYRYRRFRARTILTDSSFLRPRVAFISPPTFRAILSYWGSTTNMHFIFVICGFWHVTSANLDISSRL